VSATNVGQEGRRGRLQLEGPGGILSCSERDRKLPSQGGSGNAMEEKPIRISDGFNQKGWSGRRKSATGQLFPGERGKVGMLTQKKKGLDSERGKGNPKRSAHLKKKKNLKRRGERCQDSCRNFGKREWVMKEEKTLSNILVELDLTVKPREAHGPQSRIRGSCREESHPLSGRVSESGANPNSEPRREPKRRPIRHGKKKYANLRRSYPRR